MGLLADTDYFCTDARAARSGIYLLVISALLETFNKLRFKRMQDLYVTLTWQDSQVPGHKIKYSLYFYTYNKTLSSEVKYLSSFQSYYSSAISIQFFGYFNSSNSWTVYTI